MGLKISVLVVGTKYEKPLNQITEDLGLGPSTVDGEVTLMEALNSDDFCIGFFDSCTIITSPTMMNFFNEEPSALETSFSYLFSHSQMIVSAEWDGDYTGFSIITKGKRERTRFEGEEEGSIVNVGNALPEERGRDMEDLVFHLPSQLLGASLDSERVLATKMFKLRLK